MVLNYPFNPRCRASKCMLLLKPYPISRYPVASDVLESVFVREESDCQFCIARGYPKCVCSPAILQRSQPVVPASLLRKPWTLWAWFHAVYEVGMKKQRVELSNYPRSLQTSDFMFHMIKALFPKRNAQLQPDAYRHYIQAVTPCSIGFQVLHRVMDDGENPSANQPLRPQDLCAENPPSSAFVPLVKDSSSTVRCSTASSRATNPETSKAMVLAEAPHRRKRDSERCIVANDENREAIQALINEIDSMPNSSSPNHRFSCKLCGYSFSRKYDLKGHIRDMHLVSRDFVCPHCDRKFKRMEHVDIHTKQVHEKLRFSCEQCGNTFSNEANLRKHVRMRHIT
jgi:transposase-like protein